MGISQYIKEIGQRRLVQEAQGGSPASLPELPKEIDATRTAA